MHISKLSKIPDKCKSMAQIKQTHAQSITTAHSHTPFLLSRILNFSALSPSGDLSYALKLFLNTPKPNIFMWNTIIRAHASTPNPSKSLFLYIQMRRRDVPPGTHTFPFVLKACTNLNSKCYLQVHSHVLKHGFLCDSHVVNGLVRCYSVSSELSAARVLFNELGVSKSLSVWTSMVCGYAQNGEGEEAISLFGKMVDQGFEPSGVVLSSVLSACGQAACLELGKEVHFYLERKFGELDVILGTAVIDMYMKNGELGKAKECFDGLRVKNVATWNAMICGLAVHGHGKEAIDLFGVMKEGNVRVNGITVLGVLSACCHAGLLEYGREVFYSMKRVYGIEPNIKHYGCMVDLLGRGGRILEAESLIKGMAWKGDVVIWGALLSACKEFGNIEVAERAVKEILDLDPNNHGVYVILSNMYAEAGRWEDVIERRKGMKEGSLKKTAGWSMVDGE